MPDTFTSTYTLIIPVREALALDAARLSSLLAAGGLRAEMPPTARLDRHEYVPVTVFVEGREVHTGLTLGWRRASPEVVQTIDGELGDHSIWAKNAPMPADENEVPLAWHVAVAIARAGRGAILDPFSDAILDADAGAGFLETAVGRFDFDASAWNTYAYDLFRAAEDGDVAGVNRELDRGVSVESRDSIGETPLLVALRKGRTPELARNLIARGARLGGMKNRPRSGQRARLGFAVRGSRTWARGRET